MSFHFKNVFYSGFKIERVQQRPKIVHWLVNSRIAKNDAIAVLVILALMAASWFLTAKMLLYSWS